MKAFFTLFVFPVLVFAVFLSGAFPNTLIYDDKSLAKLKFEGKEPITAEVDDCEFPDPGRLPMGAPMETQFRATLKNHTDRYVVVSTIGEVFGPSGPSSKMQSQLLVLSPDETQETSFSMTTFFVGPGRYDCEMRYIIGRFKG